MKLLLKTYLPSASITFTAVVLFTAAMNLADGFSSLKNSWLLELFAFVLLADLLDFLLGKINFKSYPVYFLTEGVLFYLIMLCAGYFLGWFVFTPIMLLKVTAVFLLVFCLVHLYFRRLSRQTANEINASLQKQEKESTSH